MTKTNLNGHPRGNEVDGISIGIECDKLNPRDTIVSIGVNNANNDNILIQSKEGHCALLVFGKYGMLLKSKAQLNNMFTIPVDNWHGDFDILGAGGESFYNIDIRDYYDIPENGAYRLLLVWTVGKKVFVSNVCDKYIMK